MSKLSPRIQGTLYALFAILVWSGWMASSSYGVRGSLTAYDITALRFGTAAVLLLPLCIRKGLRIGPYGIWGALWLTLLMGAAYNTLCIIGFKYAPTSHGSIIQTTVLLLTTIGGMFMLRERLKPIQAFGILLSVIGIACLLEAGNESMPDMWIGHTLFFIGGVMWACYTLSLRKWKADPLQVAGALSVISAAVYLPIYFLFLPKNISIETWQPAMFHALYQGVLNSIFALICYNRAVALLGAANSSIFLPLIPVLASLMAIPLLGEVPTWLEWTGMGLAGIGVLLAMGMIGRVIPRKA